MEEALTRLAKGRRPAARWLIGVAGRLDLLERNVSRHQGH
jgi:hypothetical protein